MVASVTLVPALMGLAGDHNQEAYRSGLLASAIVAPDIPILRISIGFAIIVVIAERLWTPLTKSVNISFDKPMEETYFHRWSRHVQ